MKSLAETRKEKGVAGLTILMSVIALLFVIGLLIMVFSIMGAELQGSTTDATAIGVINDTTVALSEATDWFDIIVVITVMVVLILLVVIIISAIRGSGLIQQGGV